jgi:hypothetical protein
MTQRPLAGMLALLLLVVAPVASSTELLLLPRKGETLEDVATRIYGDERRTAVLLRYNDLSPGTSVTGRQLRAPFSETHVVGEGETWQSLALEVWGNGLLAAELATLVAGARDAALEPGSTIALPVTIDDELASGETLAAVSRRHYFRSGNAALLARVNGIRDPRRLQVGARVRVPVVLRAPEPGANPPVAIAPPRDPEPRTRAKPKRAPDPKPAVEKDTVVEPSVSKPSVTKPPVTETPVAKPSAPTPSAAGLEQPLQQAIGSYRDGDYAAALERLSELRPEVESRGGTRERRLLFEHLLYVQVAYDRPDEACASFAELRAVEPGVRFDPDLVSPKIRQLVERCEDN